jgi:hypothetical protein
MSEGRCMMHTASRCLRFGSSGPVTPLAVVATLSLLVGTNVQAGAGATGFDVKKHGFSFENSGWGKLCYSVDGVTKLRYDPSGTFCSAGWGLCGGMSLYAGERFLAGMQSIQLSQTQVEENILNAQFRTLDPGTVKDFLDWIAAPDVGRRPSLASHSVGYLMKEDWEKSIRPRLSRQEPVVLGLVFDKRAKLTDLLQVGALADLTSQHQVLGIGYSETGNQVEIRAYDPNYKEDVLLLTFTLGKTGVSEKRASGLPLRAERAKRTVRGVMFVRSVPVLSRLEIRTKAPQAGGGWLSRAQEFSDGPGVLKGKFRVGDINNDGRADVVYAFYNDWAAQKGLELRSKVSKGDGTWDSKAQTFRDGPGVLKGPFRIGDINHDGRADVVYSFYNDWAAQKGLELRSKISKGDGTWASKAQTFTDGAGVLKGRFLMGDINGDGNADVVYAFYNDWAARKGLELRSKISRGDGTWASKAQTFGDGRGVLDGPFLIGDVNGDGSADVVYTFYRDWGGKKGLEIRAKTFSNGKWQSQDDVFPDGGKILEGRVMLGDTNGDKSADVIYAFERNWR